ncbi:hypothetical protein C2G38_2175868 [Gigaspora rosea]|uniref:Uncharacterized protein n=1 Tax=Gigaspora rosea TaxID=44941 RepID=A0A397VKZ7_9GLOM|nr:hypothetical protein C2G38_2175868 [Gigaspora rosea]
MNMSVHLLSKSAETGHVSGTYNVRYCDKNGIGAEKDEYKAFIYFQRIWDTIRTYNVEQFNTIPVIQAAPKDSLRSNIVSVVQIG